MNMEKEIADIKAYCERLRADLSATNALLLSIYEALPVVYQEKVLPLVAARLAAREQLSGQPLPIEVERAMEQAETSLERLWDEATAVHQRSVAALKTHRSD